MRIKRLLVLVMLLLSMSIVSAISIIPQQINVSLLMNEPKTLNFSIYNNHDYPYYNVSFSTELNITSIAYLEKNTTINHSLTVMTPVATDTIKIITAWNLKKLSVTANPVYYLITLNGSGFYPYNLTIRPQDYLVFNNTDIVNHTVTDINGTFDYTVLNQTQTVLQFGIDRKVYDKTSMGTFSWYVNSSIEDIYIHDSSQDYTFYLNIHSAMPKTNITTVVLDQNKEMWANDTVQGKVIVQSIGNPAYFVHLSGDRFVFDKQDFNISANSAELITFNYTSNIKRTVDTNMSYNYTAYISGMNFDNVGFNYSVFIRYEYINGSIDPVKEFCMLDYDSLSTDVDRRQYLTICKGEKLSEKETITKTIVQEVIKDFDVSAQDIKNTVDELKKVQDRQTGLEQTFNQRVPNLDEPLNKIVGYYQEMLLKQDEQFKMLNDSYVKAISQYEEKIQGYQLADKKRGIKTMWTWIIASLCVGGLVLFMIMRASGNAGENTNN